MLINIFNDNVFYKISYNSHQKIFTMQEVKFENFRNSKYILISKFPKVFYDM